MSRSNKSKAEQGRYMCPECGQIFNDKKSVESHLHMMHEQHIRTVHEEYHQGIH